MDCAANTIITRQTSPGPFRNGKFTPAQADIYRIVYRAQEESIKQVRPGNVVGRRVDLRSRRHQFTDEH